MLSLITNRRLFCCRSYNRTIGQISSSLRCKCSSRRHRIWGLSRSSHRRHPSQSYTQLEQQKAVRHRSKPYATPRSVHTQPSRRLLLWDGGTKFKDKSRSRRICRVGTTDDHPSTPVLGRFPNTLSWAAQKTIARRFGASCWEQEAVVSASSPGLSQGSGGEGSGSAKPVELAYTNVGGSESE